MIRQGHLKAVLGVLLIWCAAFMVVGCAGVRSEDPQEEQQGHTKATNKEQTRSPEATASEEARCEGTLTITAPPSQSEPASAKPSTSTTNDLPGCPEGGLLSGTDKPDTLEGKEGDDEIRGLGAADFMRGGDGNDVIYGGDGNDIILGGDGNDVIYSGPGNEYDLLGGPGDDVIYGGPGDDAPSGDKGGDVIYGGDGNDSIDAEWDGQRDKLYCGKGKDRYYFALRFDKLDYVDSSCEKKDMLQGMP